MKINPQYLPSSVTPEISKFEQFASWVGRGVARPFFFSACLSAVIIWLPSYFFIENFDTWQLIINTFTTIITFLMVALLQNTSARETKAINHKLNAMADALADFMQVYQEELPDHAGAHAAELRNDICELRAAVGLEDRESV